MFRAAKSALLAAVATTVALLAVLALTSCARTGEQAATTTDTRTAVRTLLDTYVDEMNRADSTAVVSAYAPDSQATVAGRERFFRGPGLITRTAGEGPLAMGHNTYSIDTLDVIPIEKVHALALVVYTVEPADEDIPAFHTTATYVLEKAGAKWQIVHAHVCPAREM